MQSGSRTCDKHKTESVESRWLLGMHEAMYRYQLILGWKPIGPHRALGDALWHEVSIGCDRCQGAGLIDRNDGASYTICASCYGFGLRPFPGAPQIVSIRQRVAAEYPEALTKYEPERAAQRLFDVLSDGASVIHDLGAGTIRAFPNVPTPEERRAKRGA